MSSSLIKPCFFRDARTLAITGFETSASSASTNFLWRIARSMSDEKATPRRYDPRISLSNRVSASARAA